MWIRRQQSPELYSREPDFKMIRMESPKILCRIRHILSRPVVSGQRGVVLIAVIWICALIMWFGLQISAETRLQSEDQIHSIRKSQALHLAIGGCYEAIARLGQPSAFPDDHLDSNWRPDGKLHLIEYHTGFALVKIELEDIKVNVNKAGQIQLKQILEKAGADEAASEQFADLILDFIDQDDMPRLHGGEKDYYRKLGLNYIPFNGPLISLDQLLLIPGMTDRLFYGYGRTSDSGMQDVTEISKEFLIPDKYSLFNMLTVYGNNVNLAPDEDEQEADPRLTWKAGGVYRILSFGKSANGPPTVGMWVTVRLTPGGQNPYKILSRKIL
jgi:general secretion pathway protein K